MIPPSGPSQHTNRWVLQKSARCIIYIIYVLCLKRWIINRKINLPDLKTAALAEGLVCCWYATKSELTWMKSCSRTAGQPVFIAHHETPDSRLRLVTKRDGVCAECEQHGWQELRRYAASSQCENPHPPWITSTQPLPSHSGDGGFVETAADMWFVVMLWRKINKKLTSQSASYERHPSPWIIRRRGGKERRRNWFPWGALERLSYSEMQILTFQEHLFQLLFIKL